jgi:hypothetical protein
MVLGYEMAAHMLLLVYIDLIPGQVDPFDRHGAASIRRTVRGMSRDIAKSIHALPSRYPANRYI